MLFWLTYLANTSFACFASSISSKAGKARGFAIGFVAAPVFFNLLPSSSFFFARILRTESISEL